MNGHRVVSIKLPLQCLKVRCDRFEADRLKIWVLLTGTRSKLADVSAYINQENPLGRGDETGQIHLGNI